MERHAFALQIKEGKSGDFRANLGKVWPSLKDFLDAHQAYNFSIWTVENMVFGYFETKDALLYTDADKETVANWEAQYGDAYTWVSTPFQEMRLMYHDFGIVRESKELIRHRVFITKLVPGSEEEYKRRHDALVEARGDKITQGPDSNFSIWNAGGYIFGYCEKDITMEHNITPEEREGDRAWETKMLEIMSWLTDDVDWLTGMHHDNICRIAHYK